jgi:hypothetical protein
MLDEIHHYGRSLPVFHGPHFENHWCEDLYEVVVISQGSVPVTGFGLTYARRIVVRVPKTV